MSDNPLKQYFRRPSLFLRLPSEAKGYPPGSINLPDNGELPIYPMTAIDEITARTPDALFNGVAVAELIKSCVPNIIDPWSVLQTDLDALLLAIKIASNGSTMEIESKCQNTDCGEISNYDINLSGLLSGYQPGNYETLLPIGELQIKFKSLTYKKVNEASNNQFEVQRALNLIQSMPEGKERDDRSGDLIKGMNDLAMNLIVDMIEFIKADGSVVMDRDFIKEYLSNCDIKTYEKIREASINLKKTTETKPLEFKCIHCEHEYEQPFNINVSDFLG